MFCDSQPAFWVLLNLLNNEIDSTYVHDVERLRALVRKRMSEQAFVDQGGDPVIDPRYQMQLEQMVEIVSMVLERVMSRQQNDRLVPATPD